MSVYGRSIYNMNRNILDESSLDFNIKIEDSMNFLLKEMSYADGLFDGIMNEVDMSILNEGIDINKVKETIKKFWTAFVEWLKKVRDSIKTKVKEFVSKINYKANLKLIEKLYDELNAKAMELGYGREYMFEYIREKYKEDERFIALMMGFDHDVEIPSDCGIDNFTKKYYEKCVNKNIPIDKKEFVEDLKEALSFREIMSIVIALAKKPVNSIEDLINILKNYKNNEYNVVLKYNFPNKNFVDVLKDKYDQIPDIINYINGYIKQLSSIINDITNKINKLNSDNNDSNISNLTTYKECISDALKVCNTIVWVYQDYTVNIIFKSTKEFLLILNECKKDFENGKITKKQ